MSRTVSLVAGTGLAIVSAASIAGPAQAGVGYCVICKNPDQTYVCRIKGEGSRPNDALKLYCVVRTAKEGKHASCSASRDLSSCDGVRKVYSYDGPTVPSALADDPRVKDVQERVAREQAAFEKPEGKGPQTLVDLTGRAISASRKGIRNMRDRISGSSDEPEVPAAEKSEAPVQLTPPQSTAALPEPPPPAAAAPERITPQADDTERPSRFKRMTNAVKGAGSAVGGFAGRSYRCMRSLFRNCRGETETE